VKEAARFVERSLTQVMFDHAASAKVAHISYLALTRDPAPCHSKRLRTIGR